MFRGEIFGYPMYLVCHFMIPRRVKFVFADVMCKLWGFMTEKQPSIESGIKPALSVMHAKGHSLDCQVRPFLLVLYFNVIIRPVTYCKFVLFRSFGVENGKMEREDPLGKRLNSCSVTYPD